ncbi:MAG: hypothetical protein M4579_004520 [Chaenotheca gracillima]|nr:MAG: hypothetical protein M4579_004520 [Chaenotheca gracillima]
MSYTDDAVLAKLSALNESQESIVTVAQWIMFHKRHADNTARLWFQRLKDSGSGKRLNLIYLANEVAQQSKARKKDDFLVAFSPVIVEATAVAYRGATNEVQQKLRRVIEVWRGRQIFEPPILEAVETRVDGKLFLAKLDKSRSSGKKPLLSGGFGSSSNSTPAELQPLVPLQIAVSKSDTPKTTAVANANHEFEKLSDPSIPTPTPPVQAARLSSVLKSLANAEGAVAESIKARRSLVEGLEKILDINRNLLKADESSASDVGSRKISIEAKKREVEDGIMRGLADEVDGGGPDGSPRLASGESSSARESISVEPERPAHEELTPPSVEALTPTGSPGPESLPTSTTTGADIVHEKQPTELEPMSVSPTSLQPASSSAEISAAEFLSTIPRPAVRNASGSPPLNGTMSKKRKLTGGGDDFPDLQGEDAMDGLDDDVAAMLRQDSEGAGK